MHSTVFDINSLGALIQITRLNVDFWRFDEATITVLEVQLIWFLKRLIWGENISEFCSSATWLGVLGLIYCSSSCNWSKLLPFQIVQFIKSAVFYLWIGRMIDSFFFESKLVTCFLIFDRKKTQLSSIKAQIGGINAAMKQHVEREWPTSVLTLVRLTN